MSLLPVPCTLLPGVFRGIFLTGCRKRLRQPDHVQSIPSPSTPGPESHALRGGLGNPPPFTRDGVHPFDQVEWELRDAVIADEDGRILFEQKGVEFPKTWSLTASSIVASKYFQAPANPGKGP